MQEYFESLRWNVLGMPRAKSLDLRSSRALENPKHPIPNCNAVRKYNAPLLSAAGTKGPKSLNPKLGFWGRSEDGSGMEITVPPPPLEPDDPDDPLLSEFPSLGGGM